MSISDDGHILEGSEDGEVIYVILHEYSFIDPIDPAKFIIYNLPAGVSKGSVTRMNATTATMTLSGNSTEDYDTNITDVTVEVDADQIEGYSGPNPTDSSYVTLEPTLNVSQVGITQGGSVDYSATFLGEQDRNTMKITSNGIVDTGIEIYVYQNFEDELDVSLASGLRIRLANSTPSKNTGEKIQNAIQALGPRAGGLDFSTWTVSTSGTWDSGETGERFNFDKSGVVHATISGQADITEYVDYSIDDIIKGQDITVKFKGRDYDVSVSSTDNEADGASSIVSMLNGFSTDYDRFYSYSNPAPGVVRLTSKLPNTNVQDATFAIVKQY